MHPGNYQTIHANARLSTAAVRLTLQYCKCQIPQLFPPLIAGSFDLLDFQESS